MGCHNTTNKQKQKNKEEEKNKKNENFKHINSSGLSETQKNTSGNHNNLQILNKLQNFMKIEAEKKQEFERISDMTILDEVNKFYLFEMNIGSGSYGIVRKARKRSDLKNSFNLKNNQDQGKIYAIKSVWKDIFYAANSSKNESDLKYLKNEIEIILNVDHENIVKCYEIYEDKNNIHFVFEFINGSDLSSLFTSTNNNIFNINKSIEIFLQILEAIQYLHSKNIIHRDIKPENFLIFDNNGKYKIKLIDFGFAINLNNENEKVFDSVGSLPYISPEMIMDKGYSFKTDIFSAGVLFFNLITGKQPFFGKDSKETLSNICYEKHVFPEFIDNMILKDFVDCLLEKDPEKRLSASEGILHTLISHYKDLQTMHTVHKSFQPNFENNKTMLDLIEFNKLRNNIWNILLSELDIGLANKIKYYLIDLQNNNYYVKTDKIHEFPENLNQGKYTIKYSKFLEVIIENDNPESNLNIKLNEILTNKKKLCEDHIFNFVDLLDYFINSKNIMMRERIWNEFRNNIEKNNDEFLKIEDIKNFLIKNCKNIDFTIFDEIIQKRKLTFSTKINFEEFDLISEEYEKELLRKNKLL